MEKIIVIGGGLMGCSVAWKLAEQGAKVTILEQQAKQFVHGSSYGAARIARSLGPKKDIFSFVHNRTVKEVKRLIDFLNKKERKAAHQMTDIYSTSPVSYLYNRNQYDQINRLNYKKQRKDFRRGTGDAAFRKFGVTLKSDEVLVREFRKYSGTLNPQALIQKLQKGILRKGGKIKFQKTVKRLIKKDDLFELTILNNKTGKTRTIKAKKVIVATGPYTVEVLQDFAPYFNRLITPKRVLVAYFKISDQRYAQFSERERQSILDAQPMFSQIGKEYYSLIEKWDGKTAPIIKAGGHKIRRNIIDLDRVWTFEPPKKELKWIKKQFRKYLKMLEIHLPKKDIELVKYDNCVYSMTRSEVPLVTPIFNQFGSLDKNIVVIGGMSGVGAKGCLAYGAIAANLILNNPPEKGKNYKKAIQKLSNAPIRLHTRKVRRGRLF